MSALAAPTSKESRLVSTRCAGPMSGHPDSDGSAVCAGATTPRSTTRQPPASRLNTAAESPRGALAGVAGRARLCSIKELHQRTGAPPRGKQPRAELERAAAVLARSAALAARPVQVAINRLLRLRGGRSVGVCSETTSESQATCGLRWQRSILSGACRPAACRRDRATASRCDLAPRRTLRPKGRDLTRLRSRLGASSAS